MNTDYETNPGATPGASTNTNLVQAVLGGGIAALVGAVVWAALFYYGDLEHGALAWGIGGLVGFGVALSSRGGDIKTGVIAVLFSVVSILGGKYAAVYFTVDQALSTESIVASFEDEEFVISFIADEIAYEKQEAGEALDWPAAADLENPESAKDYPVDVWSEAGQFWGQMSDQEQEEFRQAQLEAAQTNVAAMKDTYIAEGFKASFGVLDILFFGLAVFTAFQIGSSKLGDA